jgi:hypothetical protein
VPGQWSIAFVGRGEWSVSSFVTPGKAQMWARCREESGDFGFSTASILKP